MVKQAEKTRPEPSATAMTCAELGSIEAISKDKRQPRSRPMRLI